MNALWQKWITTHGGTLDERGELTLANAPEQMAALKRGQAWAPLTGYGLLCISGEDAALFLQGQFSSDVRQLDDGQTAQYSSYSTAKGRMLASFLLWRRGADYYLMLSRDLLADTVKRLGMFVLRAKVKIADVSDELALLGVQAEDSLGLGDLPAAAGAVALVDGLTLVRLGNGALLVAGGNDAVAPLCERLATATAADSNSWRWLDLCAGIVWVRAATKEGFVPQMANMDVIGAVSFTKGCYPGQEVVARAQYRGQIKRHLYRIASAGPLAAGDELVSAETGEQAIGLLADVCHLPDGAWQALAVVQDAAWDSAVSIKSRPAQMVQPVCRQGALIRPATGADRARVHAGHPDQPIPPQFAVAASQGELHGFIGLDETGGNAPFVDPQAQIEGLDDALRAYAQAMQCTDRQPQ